MASPLVSVVTPVYNGEEYLAECIESVIGQTAGDLEHIIVDNCSDDGTREIAEAFAAVDTRIRYTREHEFLDVIANHNRAFRLISPSSTYCKVVQADDWLYPECLERMVGLAEENPGVGIIGAYRMTNETVHPVGLPYEESVVPGIEVLRHSLLGRPNVTGPPSALLFRSELVRARNPFWEPSLRHADTEAAFWALTRSDFGFVHELLTFCRWRKTGETPVSLRLNSYLAEDILMLLCYGPGVLSETEYRERLRTLFKAHIWWEAKQSVRPSRLRDRSFQAYQRAAVEAITAAGADDRDVLRATSVMRLLLRQGFRRKADPTKPSPDVAPSEHPVAHR